MMIGLFFAMMSLRRGMLVLQVKNLNMVAPNVNSMLMICGLTVEAVMILVILQSDMICGIYCFQLCGQA